MGASESPEAAYWAFFESFNARDLAGWAGVNTYPHARVSSADADLRQRGGVRRRADLG